MEQVPEPATYQVFISHRGPDAKFTHAILMYYSLRQCGLRVFLDHKELPMGDTLSSAIFGAIRSASVYIVLFSKNYAESPWCLKELCCILRSSHKRTIIPVYSDVEPTDLRHIERGCYAQAFRKHEARKPMEEVNEWKQALREAADISGFAFKTRESDHGRFLENIVNIVLKVVKRESLELDTYPDSRQSSQLETGPVFGESSQLETYQVFISHRGTDAKLTHASLIYHSLRQCGLRAFLDQKELRMGDTLTPAIEGAIRSASVHVVIFSTNYAESRWCLDELCWIFKSVHERTATIVPMFCDVEPTHLRNISTGPYAKAFNKHKGRGKSTMKWEEALKKAADISGIIVKTNQSDYGMYLEQIVKTVFTEVKRKEPLEVATHPVGLDEAAKDFENKIGYQRESKETKIVGIVGTGSLGKSTLAKHLYNVKRFDFTRSSFLFNVRGRYLPSLQEQLIRDLLMDHDLKIDNTIEGKGILQRSLPGLQSLIVLDDVDDVEQIDSLLDMDAVGSGSLILLTSRDKDLLRRSSPKTLLYDVKPLNRQHAQELFCHHAFFLPTPVQGFEDLVEEFLKICGGFPSSLKVLGRHLAGNDDKTYWKRHLEKFSRQLPDDIINILKVSYKALRREEKEMFLDIGCFLVGEDRELAVLVLEGLGYSNVRDCLESLRQKCLVEYNYDVESNNDINYKYELSRVIMHNQIKGLARHIAREEFFEFAKHKPLRLSCSSDIEEIFQLQDGSESCLTRGIRIPKGQNPPQLTNYINIRGVRLLVVEHPMDLSSFAMSGNLVWLRFNSFPSISIPSTISLARLRVLELHTPGDHLQQLFDRFNELSCELRKLKSGAIGAASGSTSSNRKPFDVEHYMNFCRNIFSAQQAAMTSFSLFPQSFPIDFGKLKDLMKSFSLFPQSFPIDFGKLKDLRYLDLFGCTNLTELPSSFSELLHLQYLSLQYCINLSIPSNILGKISTLQFVNFKGCAKLVHLPEGMTDQRSLVFLNLEFCFELKTLTHLSNLKHLKFLNINGCVKLETLNLEGLRSLEKLNVEFCFELKTLTDLSNLEHLKFLNINGCVKLETLNLEGLRSLKKLNVEFCFELKTLTDLSNLEQLKFFNINGCVKLEILNLEGLRSLKYLNVEFCSELKTLTNLSNIEHLKSLNINGCVKLETLNLEGLRSLEYLNLEFCSELTTLRNLSNLEHLKFLNVNGCVKLETLNLEGLRSLEQIKAEACWKLRSIEASGQKERLNCLQISTHTGVLWWVKLETLNLEDLRSLELIKAEACWKLKSIEELGQREQLKCLQISTLSGGIWNDAFQFFKSRSYMSTAISTEKANDHMEKKISCIVNNVHNFKVLEVPATTTVESPVLLDNVKSHDALFMCFITSSLSGGFRVRFEAKESPEGFEASESPEQYEVYDTLRASGSGERMLHIFMWTRDPKFAKYKSYQVVVYHSTDGRGNELEAEDVDKGWIVMGTYSKVVKVCKRVISAFVV